MILFVHTSFSSFVRIDYETLAKHYPVKRFQYRPSKTLLQNAINQVKLLFWLLTNIGKARYVFIYFADYHSLLPVFIAKLFKKKSALILAGYDVTHLPELKYGSFSNPLRGFCAKFSMENTTYLAPVDESLIQDAKKWVKNIKGEIQTIPFGYDPQKWFCDTPKEKFVLSVGPYDSMQRIKIKGVDLLLKVAEMLEQYRFILVGVNESLKSELPNLTNVEYVGKIPQEELRKYYSRSKVYIQISLREGLPNALCEAMLCECIPVGSKVNGIPNAIGDAGFLVEKREPDKVLETIKEALNSSPELGAKARERIKQQFPPDQREKWLLYMINSE